MSNPQEVCTLPRPEESKPQEISSSTRVEPLCVVSDNQLFQRQNDPTMQQVGDSLYFGSPYAAPAPELSTKGPVGGFNVDFGRNQARNRMADEGIDVDQSTAGMRRQVRHHSRAAREAFSDYEQAGKRQIVFNDKTEQAAVNKDLAFLRKHTQFQDAREPQAVGDMRLPQSIGDTSLSPQEFHSIYNGSIIDTYFRTGGGRGFWSELQKEMKANLPPEAQAHFDEYFMKDAKEAYQQYGRYPQLFWRALEQKLYNDIKSHTDLPVPPNPDDGGGDNPSPHPDDGGSHSPDVQTARQKLDQLVSSNPNFSASDRQQFKQYEDEFLARADKDDISAQEVAKTLDSTARLLSSDHGVINANDRAHAAFGIMQHAAHPDSCEQGGHPTCNVTTVETRTFALDPHVAADMIASAAIDGKWTSTDGKVITLDQQSLQPDGESRMFPPRGNMRDMAGHLFQVTALNDYGQRHGTQYVERNGQGYWKYDSGGWDYFNGTDGATIADMALRLSPPDNPNEGVVLDFWETGRGIENFRSLEEFDQDLAKLTPGSKEAIIVVNGYDPIFGGNKPGPTPNHVISVLEYDRSNGRVLIDNQWGQGAQWVAMKDLYRAATGRSY